MNHSSPPARSGLARHAARQASPITALTLVAAVAFVATSAFVTGCGGDPEILCPTGFHAEGVYCYPDLPGGDDPDTNAVADAPTTTGDSGDSPDQGGGGDTGTPTDTVAADVADTTAVDVPTVDVAKDTGKPKSPIGSACGDDLDCLSGMACFNWPKGYCTTLSCATPGQICPGAAVCFSIDSAISVCALDCDGDTDCRGDDGYGCKRLTAAFGGIDARLCLPGGANPAGMACAKPLDCAGSATCITEIPGGYCARVGCGSKDPCDSGTACVLRNGKPLCLKTCVDDGECKVPGSYPRLCVAKTDLSKQPVKVCLDSSKKGAVGEPCQNDGDCESSQCTLVANGTCKTGEAPCINDTQCGAAGPCEQDPSKEKGVCTASCSTSKGCTIGGVCVPGSAETSGSCKPTCKGPGDTDSCNGVPDHDCVFGQPIAPPNTGGTPPTYACAAVASGAAGSPCTTAELCTDGFCITNDKGTAGYCATYCGAGKPPCPFGTTCSVSGVSICQKTCTSEYDCPPLMACTKGANTQSKICQLP